MPPTVAESRAAKVDAEHQACLRRGTLHRAKRHPCTDLYPALDDIDIADIGEPFGRQQHIVVLWHRAGHQRGAPALHGDEHAGVAAGPQYRSHLIG